MLARGESVLHKNLLFVTMHALKSPYRRASSKLREAAIWSAFRTCIPDSQHPPAALHAAGSFLPSSFYLSSASSSHSSVFVHLLSTSCCFLISSLPTCLSLILRARAAPWIEGNCQRGWKGMVGQPKLPSAACIHTAQWLAEQWDELCRRLKGQTGDYTADASKQKLKIHKSFQHWQLQLSHWALFVTLKQGSSWVSSCPQAFA